jgi:hypothetical protein
MTIRAARPQITSANLYTNAQKIFPQGVAGVGFFATKIFSEDERV